MGAKVCVGDRILYKTWSYGWKIAEVIAVSRDGNFSATGICNDYETLDRNASRFCQKFYVNSTYYVYRRAPQPNEAHFHYEYFYQKIYPAQTRAQEIYQALPIAHFQSPDYNCDRSLLKRGKDTGGYIPPNAGELWHYFLSNDPNQTVMQGITKGIAVKGGLPCVEFQTLTNPVNILSIPYGVLCRTNFDTGPLIHPDQQSVQFEVPPEPEIDWGALARNWRRF